MNKTKPVAFLELRRLLEGLGYRHVRASQGEIFEMSKDRELYFRRYGDDDLVTTRDLAKTRSFLDDWNQLAAPEFDTFLDSTTKPA